MNKESKVIVHIPHSSIEIPNKYLENFVISKQELQAEVLKMTDMYTNELLNLEYTQIVFPISRLVCDVERFRDEKDEIMTKKGMWICYTKTSDLNELKLVTDQHKQEILKTYYDVHHNKLTKCVENSLNIYDKCLIIDLHSFPSKPLPYEFNQQSNRPDICIGTDTVHTPSWLIQICEQYFVKQGYSVAVNFPFSRLYDT